MALSQRGDTVLASRQLPPAAVAAHKDTHKSGGTDPFASTDLLEAIIKRLRESGGTTLPIGAVADGQFLKRSGTNVIGAIVTRTTKNTITSFDSVPQILLNATLTDGQIIVNKARFHAFEIYETVTVKRIYVANGNSVTGNVDVGIYNENQVRLVSSGSTARSGPNGIQVIDIADTVLTPGRYFMAVVSDTTGGFLRRAAISGFENELMGNKSQTSAFPLPATAAWSDANFDLVDMAITLD